MNNIKTAGGYMKESFKVNMYFDEKGEEIEKLISHFLIGKLEKTTEVVCGMKQFEFDIKI